MERRLLFIIGTDLDAQPNHRGQYLLEFLTRASTNIDIVRTINFGYGIKGNSFLKLWAGFKNLRVQRILIEENGSKRLITIKKLPRIFDPFFQDVWIYLNFRKKTHNYYTACIFFNYIYSFMSYRLKSIGKVESLIYDDIDYLPGYEKLRNKFTVLRNITYAVAKYREKLCVKRSDLIISVGKRLKTLRRKQGAKRIEVIPNGVNYNLMKKAQEKTDHPPTLVFLGTVSYAWGVDLPLEALPIIKGKIDNIRYLVIGDGPDLKHIKQRVDDLGLDNIVFFLGKVGYEELPKYLAQSDIGVETSRFNEFRKYACPLKILEYMAAGLPVIVTKGGERELIIEESNAGRIIEFSEKEMASAVLEMFSDKSLFSSYSKNAVKYAEGRDWRSVFEKGFSSIKSSYPELRLL
jgi:glycosyltransferase involved in cell wall biosynthesis